ncbi:alpha/beta-Hydrolases superfamily protein [Actinidia rufa]|uniref:Alpha/beta-Hydrolases superfamily protein n=1 Tax=Actinidia rufa TaxID=165716 RepID=A0A7J0GES7_9ERIC|nr:alpha/beta-Hydrolases superfamily protein [Actinidia rufa]
MGSLPHLVEDCQGFLQLYSDGSIVRSNDIKFPTQIRHDATVTYTDQLFDVPHNLHLRLYKPTTAAATTLPILLFLHGGGFCFGSRTWPHIHNSCLRLSSALQAIEGVDFGRVFVVGDSSGGNIAHHLAVGLASGSAEVVPVRVRGYVLMAPFFGGTVRTKAEEDGAQEAVLNVDILDKFWRLSIPVGGTADHPLANPFGPISPSLEPVTLDPILVMAGGREIMKDRVVEYTRRRMKEMKKKIEYVEFEGKEHGFFTHDPYSEVAGVVLKIIKTFMDENSS